MTDDTQPGNEEPGMPTKEQWEAANRIASAMVGALPLQAAVGSCSAGTLAWVLFWHLSIMIRHCMPDNEDALRTHFDRAIVRAQETQAEFDASQREHLHS